MPMRDLLRALSVRSMERYAYRLMRNHRQLTMIIAMIAVRMMQTSADQIINVITVRNGLMAAARAVLMA
jgi:hypothetical protein